MPDSQTIQENFYIKYANKLSDLLYEIRKECEEKDSKILNNPKGDIDSEFVDLILYNINTHKI